MATLTVTITPAQRRKLGRSEAWAAAARELAEAYRQQLARGDRDEATFTLRLEVEKGEKRKG